MNRLTINTSTSYDVLMEDGLLACAAKYIVEVLPPRADADTEARAGRKCCIVCDQTVYDLYGQQTMPLPGSLIEAGYTVFFYAFPPGEESKTIDTVTDLCSFLSEHHFDRKDFIVALGGGICGDLAGFAASIYMRGIPFVQVPTTLLAMADSSVGGKTGVNTAAGKNMIGTFWQPSLVLIDPKVLETLDETQLLNGLAEIIKAGFIADGSILDSISEGLPAAALKAIQVKKDIVEEDERESDRRRLLNFGHTIGHAIEKCSDYTIPHGFAVMNGMCLAAAAAEDLGWCSKPSAEMIRKVMDAFGYPVYTDFTAARLAEVAAGDKKRDAENIVIVYPDSPGCCAMRRLPVSELEDFISRGGNRVWK